MRNSMEAGKGHPRAQRWGGGGRAEEWGLDTVSWQLEKEESDLTMNQVRPPRCDLRSQKLLSSPLANRHQEASPQLKRDVPWTLGSHCRPM